MIAVEHMDYGALKLVKGEIDVNLLRAHDALDVFRKNTEAPEHIKLCILMLHQVQGALQVLDFTWASVLTGVMEKVACGIDQDPRRRTGWIFDTLTRAINKLPEYLAKLQEGEVTPPVDFIPLLNDLRVACGGSILSEAMVFSPENVSILSSQLDPSIKADDVADISTLAGRLRPIYQTGLLVWYRDAHNKTALCRLREVMIQLQQASPNEGLWCAAGEVIEKLLETRLEYSTSIKLLLGQVERQIRRVMDAGPRDLFLNPPTDLIKNLLYYIAVAENKENNSSEISSYKPDRSSEEGNDSALLHIATKAIKDELAWAKQKLDDFAHSGGPHTTGELRTIMDVLRRVSGTLDMLGRWELRQRVRKQAGILGSILSEESILNDPRILEVANALLYVESLLGDKKIPPKFILPAPLNNLMDHPHPMEEEEYHELCRVIVREVMVDLTQVKDNIIEFSKEPNQCDLLSLVPGLMHRIIGALTMLSLHRPTIILKAIYHYISHELLGVRIVPTQEALDTLADVLTSVEYFLETMVESQMNLDSLLDMAEGNITSLGYLVGRIDEMVVDAGASSMRADEPEIITQEETIELSSLQESPSLVEEMTVAEIIVIEEPVIIAVHPKKDVAVIENQNEDVVEEIIEIFVEEATEALETIQQYYPKWKKDINNIDALKTFRRSFHTLKGSGRLVGANVVGELSWAVESLLNEILEGDISPVSAIFSYLDECLIILPGLVEKFQITRSKVEISSDIQALIEKSKVLKEMLDVTLASKHPVLPAIDDEPLMLIAVEEYSNVIMTMDETIDLPDVIESMEIIDVYEFESPVAKEEIPGIDPILLEIFTNESAGRLKEIRSFLDHCHKLNKNFVTEPLTRNLHTLQGSAHMSGFIDIAELGDLFERHVNFVSQIQREMTTDELSALNDFVNIVDELLMLKNPLLATHDVASTMERHRELITRMNKIMESSHQEMPAELDVEEHVSQAEITEHLDEDKEHAEMVVQIFLEEAAEILENTEIALQQWMNTPGAMAPMVRLERELHTFKGGARMAGMVSMGDLSHSVESLLSAIVTGNIGVTDEIIQLLQQSHDQLHHMLDQALKRVPVMHAVELIARLEALANLSVLEDVQPPPFEYDSVATDLPRDNVEEDLKQDEVVIDVMELIPDPIDTGLTAQLSYKAISEPVPTSISAPTLEATLEREFLEDRVSKEQVRIKSDTLDNLVNQTGELSISRARLEQQVTTLRLGLNEMKQTVGGLREKIRKLDIETEAQMLFRYQEISSQGEEFDPLEFDRFSLVQQLSRGMMEGTSDLSSIQDQFEKQVGDAEFLLLQQSHMSTELQEIMMGTRLLPFSGVASRMKRLARQISRETGKLIDFDVVGEDVEMDRTVLEKIVGPLEHMIRNAIDHGIESTEKRRKIGKPDKGNIILSLSKEGVEMILRMHDDGAGFNFQAIRSKAIERGLVTEHEVVDDQVLIQFVLTSGFSTVEKVTQISGRGVGMDVVNSEIKQLGGSLTIETTFDQGSTFTIRLPVALSVARALVVKECGNEYAILHSSIDGVLRVDHATLMKAFSESLHVLDYGSEKYPIHSLHKFLEGEASEPPDEQTRHLFLMVHGGGKRAALRVDAFGESREVVVKSLGLQLSSVRGMMGATIMGNGSVVLILDIPILLRINLIEARSILHKVALPDKSKIINSDAHQKVITVMIVDDSITVRKVTSRLLERHHMHVITAKDGVDALEALQHHLPDVMLLDIEMPRMDGFELTSVMRNDARLKHIPIIMITSRTGDKHRDHALRIGVNKYLGKPYQEDELMENIRNMVKSNQAEAKSSLAV